MYKYIIKCSKCGKAMTIAELYFSKGTEITFEVLCIQDNIYEERTADFFAIQADIYRKIGLTIIEGTETVQ